MSGIGGEKQCPSLLSLRFANSGCLSRVEQSCWSHFRYRSSKERKAKYRVGKLCSEHISRISCSQVIENVVLTALKTSNFDLI